MKLGSNVLTCTSEYLLKNAPQTIRMAPLADIVLESQDLSDLQAILPKLQALREFLDQERNVVDGIN